MTVEQKIRLVNDLKSLVIDFVDLCIDENLTQTVNAKSNKTWEMIDKKLNQLGDL